MQLTDTMIWPRQVGHVALKDLRGAKWALIAYAGYVAYVTALAAGWPTMGPDWSAGPTVFITLMAVCVAAQLVLADSPSRPDNFWATRPLSPSAVFAAKLVVMMVGVLLPGAIGGLLVLRAFRIPNGEWPYLLLGGVLQQVIVILLAMALATLVRNLVSFLTALVVTAVTVAVLVWMLVGDRTLNVDLGTVTAALPVLVCAGVVWYQYATRNTKAARWIAAAGAMVTIVSVELTMTTTKAPPADATPAAPSSVTATATFPAHAGQGEIHLFESDLAGGDRLTLPNPRLYLEDANGRRDSMPLFGSAVWSRPELLVTRGLRGLSRTPPNDEIDLKFPVTEAQRAAIARGAHVRFEGTIDVDSQHVVGRTALRSGAVARMEGVEFLPGEVWRGWKPEFALRQRTIDVANDLHLDLAHHDYSFVLINESRREFLSGFEDGFYSTSSGFLTLPGSLGTLTDVSTAIRLYADNDSIPIDKAWLTAARLEVIRWKPSRSYRIALIVNP